MRDEPADADAAGQREHEVSEDGESEHDEDSNHSEESEEADAGRGNPAGGAEGGEEQAHTGSGYKVRRCTVG